MVTFTQVSKVNAWALDRITFKKILQDTAQKQQDLYRHFLEQVNAVPFCKNCIRNTNV